MSHRNRGAVDIDGGDLVWIILIICLMAPSIILALRGKTQKSVENDAKQPVKQVDPTPEKSKPSTELRDEEGNLISPQKTGKSSSSTELENPSTETPWVKDKSGE